MAKTPEGKVKEMVRDFFKEAMPKAWLYMPVPTGYGIRGIPDFIACVPTTITNDMVGLTLGLFVGIETKADGGAPTCHQKLQLGLIEQAGGLSFIQEGTELMPRLKAIANTYAYKDVSAT